MKILMVAGFLIVLLAIGWLALRRFLWRSACRAGAAKLHKELTAMFCGEHDYRSTSRSDFPGFDWSGYDQVQDALTERGFFFLGAIEDLTVSRIYPRNRTQMEIYAAEAGAMTASSYTIQGRRVLELCTEAADGRFLLTSNADVDKLTPPPHVDRCVLPAGTEIEAIVGKHVERLAALRGREPGVQIVPVTTIERVIEMSRRYSRSAAKYRRSVGLLTQDEMLALASSPSQTATAKEIWKEFQRLHESEEARAA